MHKKETCYAWKKYFFFTQHFILTTLDYLVTGIPVLLSESFDSAPLKESTPSAPKRLVFSKPEKVCVVVTQTVETVP